MEDWFALSQHSKLLGLWYLNALDLLSISLLGILYQALYVALGRQRPSWMAIALYVALLGVVLVVVPRALTLSIAPILMPVNGLLWLIWLVMMSLGLFRLARAGQEAEQVPVER